jgi:hypothetical protein
VELVTTLGLPLPDREQLVSLAEKPVPDTVTVIPTGADIALSVIVLAFTFGRSEVAVEMSSTSMIRILLVVLRVEP